MMLQNRLSQLPGGTTLLPPKGASRPLRRGSNTRRQLAPRAFLDDENGHTGGNRNLGLPLSMFTPYNNLPAEGEVVLAADASCDPSTQKCKTPIYTYESKCVSCSGTGFVRGNANGRRASLCTCLLCHGLGYVRRTTARFTPDVGHNNEVLTLGRPQHAASHHAASRLRRSHHNTNTSGQSTTGSQHHQHATSSSPSPPPPSPPPSPQQQQQPHLQHVQPAQGKTSEAPRSTQPQQQWRPQQSPQPR